MAGPWSSSLSTVAIAVVFSWTRWLNAAEPTVADCLNASETSFKFSSEHRLRAERAQLLICAAPSCPSDVRKECLRRVEELNHSIPTVVFDVKDRTGSDIKAVTVWMDDELLSERLNGSAIAVDPGEHLFRFESPGRSPFATRLLIRETQKARHQLVTWPSPDTQQGQPERTQPRDSQLSRQKVSAIVVAGVGIVGVGVGTAFGLDAMSRRDEAGSVCPEVDCRTQADVDRWREARSSANVSTAAFIVGAAGLTGAAVLWFTDSPASRRVQVGLGPGSFQLKGAW